MFSTLLDSSKGLPKARCAVTELIRCIVFSERNLNVVDELTYRELYILRLTAPLSTEISEMEKDISSWN
jgi:hypothetical protein